jgi:2-polyprenyl-6-methoxyphenol hydroxylase-like FAD-dependent oxidoreductase
VTVIGGGPVGLGLAIELGRRGVGCTVVERYEQPQPIPRGQNLTQRTMEHFQVWGAEQQLRAARTVPRGWGQGGLVAYGTLLGDYSYDWMQRELVRPYYYTDNERLPQYATEAVLRRRAAELPAIEILTGWSGSALEQDGEGVTATITHRASGETRTLRCAYLVGSDGARSMVRQAAGITQTRSDHDRLMVLLVFRSEALHRLLERYPNKSFYSVLHPDLDGYWRFFGRVDLGSTFFFHAPVPPGTTAENYDFTAMLHEAAGASFDVAIEHIGFWDLRFAVADRYDAGRVLIAGDAAHSHPPYGGYGINLGFEDARNLGWKLAATLQGWGGPGLLPSYNLERQPVFVSAAADFIGKSIEEDRSFLRAYDPARDRAAFEQAWGARAAGTTGEVNAFEPHYEGSPVIAGPSGGVCSAKGSHSFIARPGHHLPPVPLSNRRSIEQAFGDGFTLIALDADPAPFRRAAEAMGVPLTVVADTREEKRALYGAAYVLVRPDHYVAAVAEEAGEADALLRRASGFAAQGDVPAALQ